MNLLDMRTVIISYTISNFICAIVMTILWKQNRRRFAGLGLWMADFVMQFAALVLLDLRGVVPNILSMTVSNTLIIGGTILIYIGLEQFSGVRGPQVHNTLLLAVFVIAHGFYVLVIPSLSIRSILVSLGLLGICSQCFWLLLHRVPAEIRGVARSVGIVFAAFCLVSIARLAVDLFVPSGNDFLHSNVYDTVSIMAYQMLFILLTLSLFLMVNRRLFNDLENDIAVREQAEAAILLSEEKFYKAFHSSPDAILISRLRDGRLIEVNDGFTRLSGYSREEALSSSSINLGLWDNPQERERIVAELGKNRRVREFELAFRNKYGTIVRALYSGEIIDLAGEAHILSIVRDMSERQRAERLIRSRLRLWEFSASHSVGELMQKALDEIEDLTGSMIGFYHFVEADQNTLSLQAWSTRTLEVFCVAKGKGMHYPISEAGVWVDCVHQRKPVIHNDYASLPHRKGMPEGHAEVVREVVVPTLQDNRVVAILGVGNKPTDYDEYDTELVAYIADLVWEIVEHKQAEEQIRLLNTQLERMAMTDELTGLTNRRSFYIQGTKEIKRSQRYQTPFSLLMLDLDQFKTINDRFGHEAGDRTLQSIANTLLENIRETDLLARLGGEEFSVMLPNTTAKDAINLAERLRLAVEETRLPIEGQKVNVTVSIGVATYQEAISNFEDLLRNADAAMYQAKNQGRNRVVLLEKK
jgi:diguanylate cyclase (GGDEF)-like protein/PAS domain S-box-containing protein